MRFNPLGVLYGGKGDFNISFADVRFSVLCWSGKRTG